jgi:hypothetical protein
VARLRGLLEEEDEDDRPSAIAYDGTIALLRALAGEVGMKFPQATVVTGPSKGVRLQWTKGGREVRLTVGGATTNKSYLYWRMLEHSGIELGLDTAKVTKYLEWIAQV